MNRASTWILKGWMIASVLFLTLFLGGLGAQLCHAQGIEDMPLVDPTPVLEITPAPHDGHGEHITDEGAPIAPEAIENPNSFIWQALFAGLVVAVLCSYLGIYVVSRKMVFIGVALAEISSAGIALGILMGFAPLIGALAFMLLGVLLLSKRYAPRRLPPDAPVGVFYVLATACAILMIAKSAEGEGHMLTLLRGDILAVYPAETLQMLAVFVVIGIIHFLFGKEFLLVSLDRDTASTLGFSSSRWDFLLFLTIGIAVALSIRSVGVLMTSSMLILPAATALLLAPRWNRAAILAPILGVTAVCVGLWLSLVGDFPSSSVIVAVLFGMFAPVMIWNTFVRRY
jgi:zinc/manganese transport system permease protein